MPEGYEEMQGGYTYKLHNNHATSCSIFFIQLHQSALKLAHEGMYVWVYGYVWAMEHKMLQLWLTTACSLYSNSPSDLPDPHPANPTCATYRDSNFA